MKEARLFLAGMYLHLVFSVLVPLGILYTGWNIGWTPLNFTFLVVYILEVLVVQVLGWVSAAAAARAAGEQDWDSLQDGWRILKLKSVPFQILNFLWSALAWFCLVKASRGALAVLLPVPILITWAMVFQSGIYGLLIIRALRRQGEKVFFLHPLCQILPGVDAISTWVMLRRIRRSSVI